MFCFKVRVNYSLSADLRNGRKYLLLWKMCFFPKLQILSHKNTLTLCFVAITEQARVKAECVWGNLSSKLANFWKANPKDILFLPNNMIKYTNWTTKFATWNPHKAFTWNPVGYSDDVYFMGKYFYVFQVLFVSLVLCVEIHVCIGPCSYEVLFHSQPCSWLYP